MSSVSDSYCNIFNCTKSDLIRAGFYRTKSFRKLMCCECSWNSGNIKLPIRLINFIHKLKNPDCIMSDRIKIHFNNYYEYKRSVTQIEDMMTESFEAWRQAPYPNVEEMVKWGFFYTGSDDVVECIHCGVHVDQWQPGDNVKEEHKKASPSCEIVK